MRLESTHVVITGGSRGIGAAMARQFAAKGASVSLVARSEDKIRSLAAELGGHAFVADLLDPATVDALIPRIEAEAGPVQVLVNNAGLETNAFFHTVAAQDIRDLTVLNLEVPMVLTRAALPGMLERNEGHLVFTSSLAGSSGFPGLTTYGATKAGLSNFAAALRMELRDTQINATVVAPGPVDTDMWGNIEGAEGLEPMLRRLRRCQLIPTKSPDTIAKRTVAAVQANRRHVRTPRRLAINGILREIPTRITEAVLSGVPLGPQPDRTGTK